MVKWTTTLVSGFIGLAVKIVRPVWGQGVWGGRGPRRQTEPYIKETCRWAPMPDIEGPAKPD
jgi:hypothetical protein